MKEHDIRLVVARQMVWDTEAWRRPGSIWEVICSLQQMLEVEERSNADRAEIAMLIKKLYAASKPPALA